MKWLRRNLSHTPFRLEDSLFDYLPIPSPSSPGSNNDLLRDSQFPYSTMQTSKEEGDINDFTLEAMSTQGFDLFDPTGASILSPESSRLFAPDHSNPAPTQEHISTESASSFTTLVEGSHSLSPTSRHSALPCSPSKHTLDRYQPLRTAPSLTNHIPNSPHNLANGQTRTMKNIAKTSSPLTQTQPRNKRKNTSDGKIPLPLDVVEQGEPKKPNHCVMKTQD
jgi:hypothetical protein